MSEKSVKKSKGKAGSGKQMLSSRSMTQIVCFVIVATAAIFGFVQARRALYGSGDGSSSVISGDKYSQSGDGGDVISSDSTESRDGRSVFDVTTTVSSDDTQSTNASEGSSDTETTENNTEKTTKVYKSTAMVIITASPVNIRAGAGAGYKTVARTGRDKTYRLLSTAESADGKEWHQIAYSGKKKGWILSSCCRITDQSELASMTTKENKTTTTSSESTTTSAEGETVEIKVSPVNIRSGAGGKYKAIARAKKGESYRLLSQKKGTDGKIWYQVALEGGKNGWIKASFCRLKNGADTTVVSQSTTASTTKTTKSTTTKSTTTKTTTTKSTTTKSTTAKSTTTKSTTSSKNNTVASGDTVEISASPVNIRSGPSMGHKVIERTSRGKVYRLLSIKKNSDGKEWCEIALDGGKKGWILRSCCKIRNGNGSEVTTTGSTTTSKTKATVSTVTSTTASTVATTTTTTTKAKESLIMSLQPTSHSAKYFVVVYKGSQSVVVYGKDKNDNYTKQVKVFTCSTGKKSSPTRIGKYRIRAKYRWRWLVGNVYGQYNSSISSDYLFHSVPYEQQDASTLENAEYDKLGSPASKGCIRMCVRDCKWIYDNCAIGTDVRIVDDSGPAGPGVPKRKSAQRYSGWDPSDKCADDNPYFSR